jgi:hypothetical protein
MEQVLAAEEALCKLVTDNGLRLHWLPLNFLK